MGRFETLNDTTKDLVIVMIPNMAVSFGLDPAQAKDIIPEDIRMRVWDCQRRDHIKDQTEDDPRNWGVQFLKDLVAIARLKKGDLEAFQTDLRAKVAQHEEKHPWCRLADIKELRSEYENPNEPKPVQESSSEGSSTDSYFEELREPDLPKGSKGRKRNHEVYEAVTQTSRKRQKAARLRRSEDGGYHRKDKSKGRSKDRESVDRYTPASSHRSARRPSRIIPSSSDAEDDSDPGRPRARTYEHRPTPSFTNSPAPSATFVNISNVPLAVLEMEAQIKIAEAELHAARLKHAQIKAMREAEEETNTPDTGSRDAPHPLD